MSPSSYRFTECVAFRLDFVAGIALHLNFTVCCFRVVFIAYVVFTLYFGRESFSSTFRWHVSPSSYRFTECVAFRLDFVAGIALHLNFTVCCFRVVFIAYVVFTLYFGRESFSSTFRWHVSPSGFFHRLCGLPVGPFWQLSLSL